MGPCARSRSESPSRAGLPAPACAFSPRARWASATRPPRRRWPQCSSGRTRGALSGAARGSRTPRSRASATWSSALSTRTRPIPPTRSTCSRRWAASTSRRCAASTWGPPPRRRRRSSTGSYPARRPCARRACAPTPWATSWAPTHQANPQAGSSFASSA